MMPHKKGKELESTQVLIEELAEEGKLLTEAASRTRKL